MDAATTRLGSESARIVPNLHDVCRIAELQRWFHLELAKNQKL
jgi:hypothetical protein